MIQVDVVPLSAIEGDKRQQAPKNADAAAAIAPPPSTPELAEPQQTARIAPPSRKPQKQQTKTGTNNLDAKDAELQYKAAQQRYGAFYVDPNASPQSALRSFTSGFDCSRLEPKAWGRHCLKRGVNLMVGMEAKIAMVRAKIYVPVDPLNGQANKAIGLQKPNPALSGKPGLGESFESIPPEYPDPGFGD